MNVRTLLGISALCTTLIMVSLAGYGYFLAQQSDVFARTHLQNAISASDDVETANRTLLQSLWITATAQNAEASQAAALRATAREAQDATRANLEKTFQYLQRVGTDVTARRSEAAQQLDAMRQYSDALFGARVEQSDLMEDLDSKVSSLIEDNMETLSGKDIHLLWSFAMAVNDFAAYGQPEPAKEYATLAEEVGHMPLPQAMSASVREVLTTGQRLMDSSRRIFTAMDNLKETGARLLRTIESCYTGPGGVTEHRDALQNQFDAMTSTAGRSMLIMGLAGVLLALGFSVWGYRAVNGPLGLLSQYFEAVSRGQLDARVQTVRKGEFARLLAYAEAMVAALREKIGEADLRSAEARKSAQESAEALRAADEARLAGERARHEGVAYAAEQIDAVASAIDGCAGQLQGYVYTANEAAHEQGEGISRSLILVERVDSAAHSMAQTASSATAMTGQVLGKAQEGSHIVEQVNRAVEDIRTQSDTLRASMQQLSTHATSIGGIMTTISDIADQTNLLALNAAIEAARAGDAGRGFAVVADEVRKLAEKTMQATREVDQVVRTIQETTVRTASQADSVGEGIVAVAENTAKSGAALNDIARTAQESAQLVDNIQGAAHEQAQLTQDMYSSMDTIRVLSARTSEVMENTQHTTGDMTRQAENLTNILQTMRSSLKKT